MAFIIKDGTGKGSELKVGGDNKLEARAVIEEEVISRCSDGDAYNFNTGLISISGDATLIYLKNNFSENMVITDIAIGAFEGITHSDIPYITVIKNATGGDLITDATAIDMNQNRNFGAKKSADIDVYRGKTSGTITGGEDVALLQINKTGRAFFSLDLILQKGSSIAIKLTGNVSSGSANYYCALIGYYKNDEEIG